MMFKRFSKLSLLFFLFFYSSVFANEKAISLKYSIRPIIENGKSILEVGLEFQGNESGITEIILPSSWAGQDELYLEISELHCPDSKIKIENTDRFEIKKISHLPNEIIQVSYHVTSREKRETEWYYRPLIQQSYFFFFGHCLFAIPNTEDQTQAHVLLEWKDFSSDWTLANSFGVQEQKQELDVTLSSFLHAVYVGGDFQILQCGEPKKTIFVAIRGKWSFSNERLTELIQKVIKSHCQFWNDFEFPYYLITVLPIGDDCNMGGTCVCNALSIFIGDLSEENEDDWKWLAWLIGHEHFHVWNGIKMVPSLPDGLLCWFTEGFTEYYAAKLNYSSQLININDYLDHINSILYDYYVSPVRNEKNERIGQDFWNNCDIQRLPYLRGFLFALEWDQKIKKMSHGKYCLDDLMLALFKQTQESKLPFSQCNIENAGGIFLPLDMVQEDLKKYIINGETFVPKEENFNDKCSVEWIEDIGFNLHQTASKGKIVGVKQGSRAFEAGLRNEQKFLDYRYIDQTISVSIVDQDGKTREIVYLKEPIDRIFPQFKLKKINHKRSS